MGLQARNRLSIKLGIGIDEIVQRIALLLGREADIAAIAEEDAILVVGAKEIVVFRGILPGF